MNNKALGIFETIGFVPALSGADAALKSAEVKLLGCHYVGSGLVSVLLSGDVSSVKVAVESGCCAAEQVGSVKSQTVIARTADGLDVVLADTKPRDKKSAVKKEPAAVSKPASGSSKKRVAKKRIPALDPQKLSTMSVVRLREVARQCPGISLDRRKIRSARKDELINAILSDEQKPKE